MLREIYNVLHRHNYTEKRAGSRDYIIIMTKCSVHYIITVYIQIDPQISLVIGRLLKMDATTHSTAIPATHLTSPN